jgi:hypothetical protein
MFGSYKTDRIFIKLETPERHQRFMEMFPQAVVEMTKNQFVRMDGIEVIFWFSVFPCIRKLLM